ncbi:solute carrier family 49 member 4 homolog [Haliotis cracherodii]|uniref:solute carrier family 49 member 4 homolog n=1 Tax=Haliotis cracherodii TaxID=6455 RepID=UPI0039E78050
MTESVVTYTNELPRSTDDNVTSDPNEQNVKEIIQLEKGDKESVWPQSGRRRSSVTFDENVTQIRFERVEQLDLHVYRRRWVVLALFSLFSCLQAAVWNQWGPIAAVSERVFGWTDGTIALFVNWGPIAYILTAPLWSWILDTKGLRVSCLVAMALIAVGSGLRCLVRTPPAYTWVANGGQLLNGAAGPVAMGGIAKLASVWFPPEERATATAIGYVIQGLGIGLTFVIGPQVVQEDTHVYNFTLGNMSSLSASDNVMEADVISQQRDQIMNYQYATFGVCAVVLLTMLMYFPSRPPKPPSPSAATTRLDYLAGLKQLFRKGRFWQIGLAYGVSTGTRDAWSSMLDVNLKAHEISQKQAGWLGFYGTIAGSIAVIATARFADHFQKRLKLFILLLTIITTAAYLWLILLILGILPESKGSTYASYILTSISSGSLSPLFYELVCETSFPVAEGVTNVSLTSMNNLAGLVFLGVMSVPGIGTVWMNWLLVSTFCLAIFLLILLPEGHNRLDVDQQGDPAHGTC